MSQPGTELAHDTGEMSIDDIADSMGADDDLPDDDLADEADDEAADGVEDDDEAPEPEDDDPEEEWTTSSGKTYKAKKSELRDGYMRQDDYQRKTAEVAERRRKVEEAEQKIEQERQQAANQLDVLIGELHRQLVGDQQTLSKLIEEDPQEFLRQQYQFSQRSGKLQQAMQQRELLQQQMTQAQQAKQSEWRAQEREKLLEKLPHWRDEKRAREEQGLIADYLTGLGYTQDDLAELGDHRALMVALDAAKYRQQQKAKDKKVREEPRKPVRAGSSAANQRQSKAQRAQEALRRNPDSLDALAAFVGASGD